MECVVLEAHKSTSTAGKGTPLRPKSDVMHQEPVLISTIHEKILKMATFVDM